MGRDERPAAERWARALVLQLRPGFVTRVAEALVIRDVRSLHVTRPLKFDGIFGRSVIGAEPVAAGATVDHGVLITSDAAPM